MGVRNQFPARIAVPRVIEWAPRSRAAPCRANIGSTDMADLRTDTAFAVQLAGPVDAEGWPLERAWETAPPVCFCADWQGKNPDRQRETQVRMVWNTEFLFLRFDARYRNINVFSDAEPSGRRDGLWDRD